MKKTGKVLNIDKKTVRVLTTDNEFIILKRNETTPIKGAMYTGEVYAKSNPIFKIILTLFILCTIIFLYNFYKYYNPKFTVICKMNASVKLKVNSQNKIISIDGLNSKGRQAVSELKLKHKIVDEGLILLFDNCIENDWLNEDFIKNNERILIYISNNHYSFPIEMNSFKQHAELNNYKVIINNNGEGVIE